MLNETHLVCHITLGALSRIFVAIIYPRLDHPLVVERRKPRRFIEESVYEFVRAIRFQLNIYQ